MYVTETINSSMGNISLSYMQTRKYKISKSIFASFLSYVYLYAHIHDLLALSTNLKVV